MSDNAEPVSAFSMYAHKRKSTEQSVNATKKKRKQSQENVTTKKKKKSVEGKTAKKKLKQQRKSQCSLNVGLNCGVLTRSGCSRVVRKFCLPDNKKKMQPVQKDETTMKCRLDETQESNGLNDVQVTEEKISKSKKKRTKLKAKLDLNKEGKTSKDSPVKALAKQNDDDSSHANDAKRDDPIAIGRKLFEWLICPLKVENFFALNWESTPVHIKRKDLNYYRHLMSTSLLDNVLREKEVFFTKNIDITSYTNGKRETHNPPGRALPNVVWDYYQNDCSVRMLNPQTFIPQLHALNATLQEFFGCFVGANSYLTPPNSQGFAPHYDDIEAFILQVEGKKRWRLYKPLNDNDYLARYSSRNFDESEIGTPILDTIVNAGDMLYLPRSTIHQATTVDDTHSLHVTLSVYQRNSWCDFLEKTLPQALEQAAMSDSSFRKGLPLNYLQYVGTAYDDVNRKKSFKKRVRHLLTQLIDFIDVDSAADSMAKGHIHDFLPPVLTKDERKCSVMEDGDVMLANGTVRTCAGITTETRIRLTRSHCVRLTQEYNTYKIYYSTENSKEYHEYELQFLEIDERFVAALKSLISSYPKFICVNELPIDDDDEKIQLVRDLWEKSLVITDVPQGTAQ